MLIQEHVTLGKIRFCITVHVSSHPAPISSVKEFPPTLLAMGRHELAMGQFCEEN